MAVRIRLKRLGRRHQTFFRVCAMDQRTPRDGRVLEELGTYDPQVPDVDARAILKGERISYWLSVGAQPSEKVRVLIKKYGPQGTHLEEQKAAVEKLRAPREIPPPEPPPARPAEPEPAEQQTPPAEAQASGAGSEGETAVEAAPAESTSAETQPAETAPTETASAEPAAEEPAVPGAEEKKES